jgi:hypothetical protein
MLMIRPREYLSNIIDTESQATRCQDELEPVDVRWTEMFVPIVWIDLRFQETGARVKPNCIGRDRE